MPFDVDQFRSKLKREPQRTNQFEVIVVPPISVIPAGLLTDIANLRYKVSGVNIPGVNLKTYEAPYAGYAPDYRVAYGKNQEDISIEVIATQGIKERMFFQSWIDFIQPTQIFTNTVRYYDRYTGGMIIRTFDSQGDNNMLIGVVNCYPTSIGSIDMNWGAKNGYATFRVSFAYDRCVFGSINELPAGLVDIIPFPEIDISGLFS